jgi:hypothetical protein
MERLPLNHLPLNHLPLNHLVLNMHVNVSTCGCVRLRVSASLLCMWCVLDVACRNVTWTANLTSPKALAEQETAAKL